MAYYLNHEKCSRDAKRRNIERVWRAALKYCSEPVTADLLWERLPGWLRRQMTPDDLVKEYPQLERFSLSEARKKEMAQGAFYISPGTIPNPHFEYGAKAKRHRTDYLYADKRKALEQHRQEKIERLQLLYERKKRAEKHEIVRIKREIERIQRALSLENVVWDDLHKRKPIDKAAAMELVYTSTSEPHYEP